MTLIDYHLTTKQLNELKLWHKLCKKRNEADRIKAVYLLGKNWTISAVCEALLLEDDAIRRYFMDYQNKGIEGLLESKYSGRASYLTEGELNLLESHLKECTYQKVTEIMNYVLEEFDIAYTDSGMRNLLLQLDFVYKRPEKIPFRVDEAAQKAFITHYKKLKKQLKAGDGVYFMDVTHPEHAVIPAYGWIKRGETKVVKSNPRPYRLNIQGAVNISTLDMVIRFEEKVNKETALDFLEALRKHQPTGWIHLICDNAGYYKSADFELYAKSMAINVIYLPPYSPNLNLMERIWKFFKKNILYNKYYETFPDMLGASKKFFETIGQHYEQLQTLMTENFQIILT